MKRTFCFVIILLIGISPLIITGEEMESHKGTLERDAWEFYGSVRVETSYWERERWYKDVTIFDPNTFDSLGVERVDDSLPINRFIMGLQNNSNFGARGRGEKFGYGIEYGWAENLKDVRCLKCTVTGDGADLTFQRDKRPSLFLRKLYGDWFIIDDFITLRIGQHWAITNFFPSSQIFLSDAGMGYSGILYTGRSPQVKLSVGKQADNLGWMVESAILKPAEPRDVALKGPKQNHEEKHPKLELGTHVNFKQGDMFGAGLNLVGGMAAYDAVVYEKEETSVDQIGSHPVKSHVLGAALDLTVWKIRLSLVYSQGSNMTNYGVWMGNPFAAPSDPSNEVLYPSFIQLKQDTIVGDPTLVPGDPGYVEGVGSFIHDKEVAAALAKQGGVVLNIQVLPWLAVEAGGAKLFADHEDELILDTKEINALERTAYYAQLQFRFADNHVKIVPEWSFSDFGGFEKTKQEDGGGRLTAYGLKFQLDI